MGFILGFLMGLLAVIGGLFGLAYWLCTRSNHSAIAKAMNGLALALAHRPKSSEPDTNGEALEDAREHANEKQGNDKGHKR